MPLKKDARPEYSRLILSAGCALGLLAYSASSRARAEYEFKPPAKAEPLVRGAPAVLAAERATIAAEIARLADQDDKENAGKPDERQEKVDQLRAIDALYLQQQTCESERRQLEEEKARLGHERESLDKYGIAEPKPYSFLLLEKLRDQLLQEQDRQKTLAADLKSAEKMLQTSHGELDQSKQAAPREPAADDGTKAFGPGANLAEIQSRAKVGLKQAEIAKGTLQIEVCKARQDLLSAKIEKIRGEATFTATDRDSQLAKLAESESRLRRGRREAENRLQRSDADQQAALRELAESHASPAAVAAATAAGRSAADVYQNEVVIFDQQIENIADLRKLWRRRFELANHLADTQKLAQWNSELDDLIDQLDDNARSLEHRRDQAREEQAAATTENAPEDAARWQQEQRVRWQELRDLSASALEEVKLAQRTAERFHGELKTRLAATAPHWSHPGAVINRLLQIEIAGEDENKVTLGSLLVLLVYIVAGILAAYLLSRFVLRRLLPRLGVHHGRAMALKSILFYSLCVLFGIMAFRLLNIPLAAFAFLGGAAAIGIGFGSQDIMNNFMSGIILLTEQPIRVGDVVDVGGVQGVVAHIGLRSTRLQTPSNHELTLPNKTLLDEQVTNMTLSDNLVRLTVTATVDRDVNIEQAKWDMLEIAFSHPLVVKSPRPLVILKEVDNYWLVFDVHFWLQYSSFTRSVLVQSEILEQIGTRFAPRDESKESAPTEEIAGPDDSAAPAKPAAIPVPVNAGAVAPSLANPPVLSVAAMAKGLKGMKSLKVRN